VKLNLILAKIKLSLMTDSVFAFMNPKVQFKDDPKFIHIDETLKCLTYVFIRHLDIFIYLCQCTVNSGIDWTSTKDNIDAGRVFNNLLVISPNDSNVANKTELTDEQFKTIVLTFNAFIARNKSLKIYNQTIEITDPIDKMWSLCHYLFVPVRLQDDTIPRNIKINSLRKWLTVAFTLPFIPNYTNKYMNAINNVQYIQMIYEKLVSDPTKIQRIKSLDVSFISKTISRTYNNNNPSQIFTRVYMNIMLMASVEIMKKYCPNYPECCVINPNYDGAWLNPVDPIYNEHLVELNNLTQYLST